MSKQNELIWIIPTIFIIIFLLMIKFCTPRINQKYVITKITCEDIKFFINMEGTVVANNITAIGLKMNLTVDDVYYKVGDFVKKGDIIVKFSDYQKSNLDEKRMLMAIKNRELRNLERQSVMGAERNEKIQKLKGEIAGLEIEVKNEIKNTALVQRIIRSPFDAYVIRINILKGGITNKNEPVLVLVKKNDLKIISESIPNDKVKNLNIGNFAEISILRNKNKKTKNENALEELIKAENIPSKKNSDLFSEKKVIEAKLFKINKIANTNILEFLPISFKELHLNEKTDIRVIYRKKENVLTVPKKAVVFKNHKNYIYLIDKNNLVKEKEIFIGLDNGKKIEIFGINIEKGMEIIENPDEKISNNVIVERKKIQDEEIEKRKKLENLEKENEKIKNKLDENEREIIKLKK